MGKVSVVTISDVDDLYAATIYEGGDDYISNMVDNDKDTIEYIKEMLDSTSSMNEFLHKVDHKRLGDYIVSSLIGGIKYDSIVSLENSNNEKFNIISMDVDGIRSISLIHTKDIKNIIEPLMKLSEKKNEYKPHIDELLKIIHEKLV